MTPSDESAAIRWPARFRPERAPVHVRNEIDIAAGPDRIWGWLVRATEWPTWYPNSADVRLEGGGTELRAGIRFHWRTFGARLASRVEEFEPPARLAWSARGTGVDVYHAWLLTPGPAGGCHVRTEETQYGGLARIDHLLRPRRMGRGHQLWLESLRARATSGPPPDDLK